MPPAVVAKIPILGQLHNLWMSLQVELHGKYSCDRLACLHVYQRDKKWRFVALVCALSPLPSLFFIALVDFIPLRPPSEGVYENKMFWLRNVLAVIIITYTVLEQFKTCLPNFPMPLVGQLITTLIVTAVAVGEQFLVALQVGFPVPFSLIVAATGWAAAVLCCCFYMWKDTLRETPALWKELINYLIVFSCQVSLPFLYPAYVYVFNSLSSTGQTAFVLMLPVIKIATKNWISRFLKGKDDLKPLAVILNVEIFNALYVALCMQNSTSKITTVVLMLVDLVQAWMGLKDMDDHVVGVQKLLKKIPQPLVSDPQHPVNMVDVAYLISQHDPSVDTSVDVWTATKAASSRSRTASRSTSNRSTATTSASGLKIKMKMPPVIPFTGMKNAPQLRSPAPPAAETAAVACAGAAADPVAVVVEADQKIAQAVDETEQVACSSLSATGTATATATLSATSDSKTNSKTSSTMAIYRRRSSSVGQHVVYGPMEQHVALIFDHLTPQDRHELVQKTLQILFITEFLMLIEFTEVMIPVIYCVYMAIMYQLPNRHFYPQMKDLTTERLHEMIGNVLMYSSLELLSFISMALILKYRLQLSTVHQLAFVLDKQAVFVQSQLILWTFYVVQSSLEHFGADFSMKFAWLDKQKAI